MASRHSNCLKIKSITVGAPSKLFDEDLDTLTALEINHLTKIAQPRVTGLGGFHGQYYEVDSTLPRGQQR